MLVPEAVVLAEDAMVGVGESPHRSGQAAHKMALRLLLLLSLTTLLALLFTGCSAGGSAGGGGNGSNECFYGSACDTSCNDDANCTDSGGSGSGTTDGGTSGGCSDPADPSCGGYDPTGTDGGGGDGGCDPSTCGDPGDGGDDSGIGEIRGYIGTVIMVTKAAETMELAQPFVSAQACASPETLSELEAVCSRFAPLETQGRLPGLSIAQTTYARVVRAKEDKDERAT